jgi:hypothetical protein
VYGCMDEEQNYQRMQKEEKNWNRLFTTILICFVTPRNERDPRVVKKDGGRAPPRDAAVNLFFSKRSDALRNWALSIDTVAVI